MRLMRMSRSACSTGTGFSPRALQRLGGLVAAAAADLDQLVDDLPAQLRRRRASRSPPRCGCRCSCRRPAGGRRRASPRGRTPCAAMNAIFCATASCLPTGWPHCTRSARPLARDLRSPTWRRRRRSPAAPGGRCSASRGRSSGPCPPCRSGSRSGTKTSSSRVTEFSMPRRPMNCVAVLDRDALGVVGEDEGADAAAVALALRARCAITTTTSAIAPLVAHSLRPLST